ncbi:MAG TPA: LacI family DNA-binding transcriptional regulator [Actinomycetota bacterium]|nr:LacI family DNA-binding transcriptional regulator [Actinomycetota bacterium]
MPQPRLKDVAAAAGVHAATASRALNERTAGMISPETVERVRRAAEELGYQVNGMARALKTRRSLAVGMLVPDITNPFFPPIVRGAEDALAAAGYTLVLGNTDNDEAKERRHLSQMAQSQVDGFLLATARLRDPAIDRLRRGEVPFVLVNRTVERGGLSAVIPDDRAAMLLAVEHLHGLGHRRIGYVGGPLDTSTGARRAEGFRAAMRLHGLRDDAATLAAVFNATAGRRAAAELLAVRPRPTAIVAANDLLALGTLDAAAEAGLECPLGVSVVGVNDIPMADRLSPSLTTARVPEYELGRRSARLLLAHLERPDRDPETVMLAPELIVRGSTAPPRAPIGS